MLRAALTRRTLESVWAQTFTDFEVIVAIDGSSSEHCSCYQIALNALENANIRAFWLVDRPNVGAHISVRIRHRSPLARGEIVRIDDDQIEIALDEPVSAIAPGQSLVLYDGDRVLGGGIIESTGKGRDTLPILAA